MKTLAFDVYGTLINTYGMVDLLKRYIGEDIAFAFASLWRNKQLEYSFRRSLMDAYEPFYTCTIDALDFCIETFKVNITQDQHFALIKKYQSLPVFKDVKPALRAIRERGNLHSWVLSNGTHQDIDKLFEVEAISHFFKDIVSVDEIRKFKPDPAVYQHFIERSGARAEDCYLISGNSFDIIGAGHFGMNTIWIKRNDTQQMDPWGDAPSHTISSLTELTDIL